jgi:hypothetical protein
MKNTLKLSDCLMVTAESVIALAKKANIDLRLTDVYNKDTATNLALIAGLMRELVTKVSVKSIEIINT